MPALVGDTTELADDEVVWLLCSLCNASTWTSTLSVQCKHMEELGSEKGGQQSKGAQEGIKV